MSTKLRHSKYRNVALLFDLLTRQVTTDVLNNKQNSKALKIVQTHFKDGSLLSEELKLYTALVNTTFKTEPGAERLISEIIGLRKRLSNTSLRRAKYNLVKEIKENYNIEDFLSNRSPMYKVFASVYMLFEIRCNSSATVEPGNQTKYANIIVENITKRKTKKSVKSVIGEGGKDNGLLIYHLLIERFNKKYSSLNGEQKDLLRTYIYSVSENTVLIRYVNKILPSIEHRLKKYLPQISDPVTKIKLTEAIKLLPKLRSTAKTKYIKDDTVIHLMKYLELIKQSKKFVSMS